jgi:fibronectin-binding autotransporter adhesin
LSRHIVRFSPAFLEVKKWNVPLFHPQATVIFGHWVGKHSEVKMKIFEECFLANFRLFKRPVAVFFASAFLLLPACAQSLYWDANGTNSGGSSNTVASGTWGLNNFWSTSSVGTNATTGWTSGGTAIFSAGTNVTGAYTVNVNGNQTAAGITFQAGTVTLSGGTVTLNGGAKITVNSGLVAIINSVLAGTAGLTKSGAGTLTLNGNNTFLGNLTNSAGTLILISSNNYAGITLLSSGTIDIGNQSALGRSTLNLAGGTLQAFNADESFGNAVDISANSTIGGSNNLTFLGNFLQQGGDRILSVNNTALTTFSGPTFTLGDSNVSRTLTLDVFGTSGGLLISSSIQNGSTVAQNLSKIGNGILTLTGSNTFTGNLNFNSGTLILGSDFAAGQGILEFTASGDTIQASGGTRTIANNVTMSGTSVTFGGTNNLIFSGGTSLNTNETFNVANTTTFSGVISGANDSLTKSGSGTLILNGNNTFGGSTSSLTLSAGTLVVGNSGAIGAAGNTLKLNGGTIQATGGAKTIANNLTIGGNITFGGTDPLTFTIPTFALGGSRTFTVNNTRTTFGGIITGTSAQNFTTSGTGTLELTGANTYSGNTTMNQGTLLANNKTGSATGTNSVTVNGGATLGGTGIISGPITLNSGATISPGNNAVGRLTTANETWKGGATVVLEFNDVNAGAGIGWDFLNLLGTLTFNANSGSRITLDLHSLTAANAPGNISDFNPNLSYNWTIATTTSGFSFSSGQNIATAFSIQTSNWSNPLAGGTFSLNLSSDAKSLILSFAPASVPEPSACALTVLAFAILVTRRGFRSRRR